VSLRLLVDRVSIDIFGNGGRLYMPMGLIFPEEDKTLALAARGGSARVRALEVYALRSAWEATVK
jgi:sucrose-6-phosphate hydrolase SacC (GH32 family)